MPVDEQNVISLNSPDLTAIRSEDEKFPTPYRFGILLSVDISPEISGKWEQTIDGGRIWRVSVRASGAQALSAYFDKFVLPEGGKVFLYNPSKTRVIGAFTSRNNVPGGYFATELIAGDRFILEYDQLSETKGSPIIHMYSISYAYRGVGFLGENKESEYLSGACEVNVKCHEGDPWQNEIKGVMRINILKSGNNWWCSGSMVNNVRNNAVPYVLTADHCFAGASASDLQQWIFYFGYESPTCANPPITNYPIPKTMTGAKLKAHEGSAGDSGSDFCLVMLNQNIPDTFSVYFNGWSRKDTASPSGVTIHHPEGDIKKISTYNKPLISAYYSTNPNPCFWQVSWIGTQNGHGVTEPGSSGSPLFDNMGRIVGELTGGDSECDSASLNLNDYYGKFSWSWDKNGSDSTTRLKDWLDPDNTGVMQLSGIPLGIPVLSDNVAVTLFPNPFTDRVQIKIDGMTGQTARLEVFNLIGTILWSDNLTSVSSMPVTLPLPGLPSGLYFLRIKFPDSISIIKMIRQ